MQRAEYADLKVYLPNDPLVKVDRMSMAHSLEVRSPLLDRRVVELAFRIPASRKQVGRAGKVLLRQLARQRLPAELWRLPKRGFTAPIGEWLQRSARPDVSGRGASDRMPRLRRSSIARISSGDSPAHRRQQTDQSTALWAVWVLERWLQRAKDRTADVACATGNVAQ